MEWFNAYIDIYGEPVSSSFGDIDSKYQSIVFQKTVDPHNVKNRELIIQYTVVLHDIDSGKVEEEKSFDFEEEAIQYAIEMSKIKIR
ncbi:hypothetical protein [Bacteroides reticulotermitis]|uniref:Uncharacterized protein n=2 Tax=Bacteroides reticulotermitis TaxID=1133319 RepID=W4V1L6_9BACE|nr:hypothetical protein [Bacteroides reticulotermitis]MBB4046467.1 hypothetical protein [Bacteroides reticulotermitis]GAE86634.1 hypothetical protein JCM10512_5166 [Bacteroides reticulotermitis JCM 10512]